MASQLPERNDQFQPSLASGPLGATGKRRWETTGYVLEAEAKSSAEGEIEDSLPVHKKQRHTSPLTSNQPVSVLSTSQQANATPGTPLQLRVQNLRKAASGDELAAAVCGIVDHFEMAASRTGWTIDQVAIQIGRSKAELMLSEVLQLFIEESTNDDQDSMFSENLMSTLLANERPKSPFSNLAPFEELAAWLSCDKNPLYSRVAAINVDIVRVMNGLLPAADRYPLQGIGSSPSTHCIVFSYKPRKHWVTVEVTCEETIVQGRPIRLGRIHLISSKSLNDVSVKETYAMALEELVPFLSLAKMDPSFRFAGAQWAEERITIECRLQGDSGLHSGPLSILTAVYRARGEVIMPAPRPSSKEIYWLVWRIRLACARRMLNLLNAERPDQVESNSLYQLLRLHTGSVTVTRPRLSKAVSAVPSHDSPSTQKPCRRGRSAAHKEFDHLGSLSAKDSGSEHEVDDFTVPPAYESLRSKTTQPDAAADLHDISKVIDDMVEDWPVERDSIPGISSKAFSAKSKSSEVLPVAAEKAESQCTAARRVPSRGPATGSSHCLLLPRRRTEVRWRASTGGGTRLKNESSPIPKGWDCWDRYSSAPCLRSMRISAYYQPRSMTSHTRCDLLSPST